MPSLYSLCFMLAISFVISQSKPEKPFFTSLEALCDNTLYSKTCHDSLSPLIDSQKNYNPQFLYNISVRASMNEVSRVFKNLSENGVLTQMLEDAKEEILLSALGSCRDFLSLALYNLNLSIPTDDSVVTTHETRTNFRTWLSAAGADLQTCLDDLKYAPDVIRRIVTANLDKSTQLVSTSLAIISKIDDHMSLHEEPSIVYRIDTSAKLTSDWEPTWVSSKDRKMLHNTKKTRKPNFVVAQDGSGKYKTITEAINAVPPNNNKRFVIYVKKGIYHENVKVGMEKWNVMIYGDGMDKTIVSSNRSNATGSSTSSSATFAVFGKGFVARDIGFQNTAGAANHQAVALLSASDQSVFYRCLIDAYQDTLYAHSNRQFYRECRIYGTIDFIFGDSAVVIQSCSILVKRPLNSHSNIITAQGKSDPNANTGISIQKCSILPAENLAGVRTFLGRPWREYSTTIVMESQLESLIDPKGWVPWNRRTRAPDTISYVEYHNAGPGAVTRMHNIRNNKLHFWRLSCCHPELHYTCQKALSLSEQCHNCSRKNDSMFHHGYIDTELYYYGR